MLRRLSKNVKITLSILLIFLGIVLISFTYFSGIKSNLFNYKNMNLLETEITLPEELENIIEIDTTEEPDPEEEETPVEQPEETTKKPTTTKPVVKDSYIGYLEIPKIKVKRGFLSVDSKYNSVKYNVMLIKGSDMPDVKNGNLILAAHRGSSSVSFFENLYKLKNGDEAKITYNKKTYTYKLVDNYIVPKTGTVTVKRNADVNTLTLITCTRYGNDTQTVFIFELASVK